MNIGNHERGLYQLLVVVKSNIKTTALFCCVAIFALAICWAAGLVEFSYPHVVEKDPLLHPQKVQKLEGSNIFLESGEIIVLSSDYFSEPTTQESLLNISNEVSRGGFEVDVASKGGEQVEIYVRWPRKFRDSVPPFTIPIFPETISRKYRKAVAFGTYLNTNGQSDVQKTPDH